MLDLSVIELTAVLCAVFVVLALVIDWWDHQ